MIKRTIEISREPVHLSTRLDQLLIQPVGEDKAAAKSIPCEDIGVVVIDHPQVSYSHAALQALMRFGAIVIMCGRDHMPAGMLLPGANHTEVAQRLREQIAATQPRQKRIWRLIVIGKIQAQADNITHNETAYLKMQVLARDVKSGDTTNIEAQAAKVYWSVWRKDFKQFNGRDTDGKDSFNAQLNYGYAVLRAAVARALVSAGLQPALGIHHANRSNAFALADDLMEPLRPAVDCIVRELHRRGRVDLDQLNKAALLKVLTDRVNVGGFIGPLMVGLHRYTASFMRCLRGDDDMLSVPMVIADGEGDDT